MRRRCFSALVAGLLLWGFNASAEEPTADLTIEDLAPAATEAVADSGLFDGECDRQRVGVILGAGTADLIRNEIYQHTVLFRGIENFKMFDLVVQLTGGGPGSITELTSINLKREAFEKWRTGYASAYAVILFVTVFGLASIYVKALNKVKQR